VARERAPTSPSLRFTLPFNPSMPSRPPLFQVFLHSVRGDRKLAAFYDDLNFTNMGYVPSFYQGKTDATVWASGFHGGELVSYPRPAAGEEVNLGDPELKRAKKTPKWVIDCALQFGLPIGIVAILFAISYGLVLLGPLRGISQRYIKDGGGLGAVDVAD
jgi:hypothetical protein